MPRRLRPRSAPTVVLAALILASTLVALEPALPAIGDGAVPVVARSVTTTIEAGRATVIALPIAATDVALHWPGSPDANVRIELATTAGAFGETIDAGRDEAGEAIADGESPAGSGDEVETFGDVIWSAGARFVRVTSNVALDRLTVEAFKSDGAARPGIGGGPVADAAVAQLPVITRAGWGADESVRFDGGGHERWPPGYFRVTKLVLHHTAGRNGDPDPKATIRSIYHYHAVTQGWGDIGYNFLIDEAGRVYEGRRARTYATGETPTSENLAGNAARGAHAKGFNEGTVAVALLGTFDTVLPTSAARASLERLFAWESERHAINPTGSSLYVNPIQGTQKTLPNIFAHRDVNATDCPGDALYAQLPSIRASVASRIAAASGPAVDHSAPVVASLASLATNPTGGSAIQFGLIFNEPIGGLAIGDFEVAGTSAGWAVTALSGVGAAYTVTVASASPSAGSIVLRLRAGGVTDLGSNAGPATPVEATATFAPDAAAPTALLYVTPHVAATTATSLDVTVTFSEPVDMLLASDIAVGGTSNAATPWSVSIVVGSGAHFGFTIKQQSPANGTLTIGVRAGAVTDPAGNPNVASPVVSTIIDRRAPTTTAPTARVRAGATLSSTVPVTLIWTGSDATGGSGIRSYDLARSVDGGAYSVLASGLASPVYVASLAPGHSYRFEARARDRAGNVGAWVAGPTIRGSITQQWSAAVAYRGTWTTGSSSSYSGGSVRYATAAGASASYTTTARSLAVVTTLGPGRGVVRIYVDGVLKLTKDTYAATSRYRYIAYAGYWTSAGTHTITVVVSGTLNRPRFDLDALAVVR